MAAATYVYRMSGGCGHTTIDITIDHKTNTFELVFSSGWMGKDAPERVQVVGNVYDKTAAHMKLVSADAGEGVAEIFHLPEPLEFELGDEEHECMVMANEGRVNKDGRYDTLFDLRFSADLEGGGKVWKRLVEGRIVKGARA